MGIDCSKYKVHLVLLDEQSNIYNQFCVESKSKNDLQRTIELKEGVENFLLEKSCVEDPTKISAYIETAIYINNIKTTNDIQRTIVSTQIACNSMGVSCNGVDNQSWKKIVLGNGKSNKEDIWNFAKNRWPDIHFVSQDYADAACIALYTYLLMVRKIID